MSRNPRLARVDGFGVLAAVAVACTLMLAPPLGAQTLTNSFGGLSQSSKDPIDIESDLLVVHDKEKYATFSGNVKAVQGTTTLRAKELNVHYVGGDKLSPGSKKDGEVKAEPAPQIADAQSTATPPKADAQGNATPPKADGQGNATPPKNDTQITKIEAKGDVIITSEDDQTTTSDWALYDLPSQQVTVGGNVVLTQGKNVLKGDRLVIDLTTGESRFENTGDTAAGGRIRALFMPKNAKPGDAKSGDSSAGENKSGKKSSGEEASKSEKPPKDKTDDEADVPWPKLDTLR
jgi:lipopolysaccharide export system protein LptA